MPAVAQRPTKPKPRRVTTAGCGQEGVSSEICARSTMESAVPETLCQLACRFRCCQRCRRDCPLPAAGAGVAVLGAASAGLQRRVSVRTLSSVCSHASPTLAALSVRISCTSISLPAAGCGQGAGPVQQQTVHRLRLAAAALGGTGHWAWRTQRGAPSARAARRATARRPTGRTASAEARPATAARRAAHLAGRAAGRTTKEAVRDSIL